MTDDEYRLCLDLITTQFREFHLGLAAITDEQLDTIEKTLNMSDSIGFMFVPPLEYQQSMKNIDDQRKLITLVREVRDTVDKMRNEAFANVR